MSKTRLKLITMTPQTESTPLWKKLNEARTQGVWNVSGFVLFSPLKPDSITLRVPYFQNGQPDKYILKPEAEANAKYTALAVNEFANVVEALTEFHNASMCFADDHKHYYEAGNEDKINEMLATLHNAHLRVKETISRIS